MFHFLQNRVYAFLSKNSDRSLSTIFNFLNSFFKISNWSFWAFDTTISLGLNDVNNDSARSNSNVPALKIPLPDSNKAINTFFCEKYMAAIFASVSDSSGNQVPGVMTLVTFLSTIVLPSGSVICSQIAILNPSFLNPPF